MTKRKIENIVGRLIVVSILILFCGSIALKVIAGISYEGESNIDILLFVIEHETLLNVFNGVIMLILYGVSIICAGEYKAVSLSILAFLLIILVCCFFVYKTPEVALQETEENMIQDLIEQGKMTKASLYNIPAELAVCFDKKFEGELCNILFEKLLAE